MLTRAGVLELHPEGARPQAQCPKCLAAGKQRPTELYWIRGIDDANHDDGIPKALFNIPEVVAASELDADTRALRIQFEGAVRNSITAHRNYAELQLQQKELFALLKAHTEKLEQRSSSTQDPKERDPDLPPLTHQSHGRAVDDELSSRPRPPPRPAPPPTPRRTERVIHHPSSKHGIPSQRGESEMDQAGPARSFMPAKSRSSTANPNPPAFSTQPNTPQRSLKRKRSPGSFALSVLTNESPPPSAPVRSAFGSSTSRFTACPQAPPSSVPPSPLPSRSALHTQPYPSPSFLGSVPNSSQHHTSSPSNRAQRATGRQSRHFQAPTPIVGPPARAPQLFSRDSSMDFTPMDYDFRSPHQQPRSQFLPHEPWFSHTPDSRQRHVDARQYRASESRERMPPPLSTPSWRRRANSSMAFSQPRMRSHIGAPEIGMVSPLNEGWNSRGSSAMEGRAY